MSQSIVTRVRRALRKRAFIRKHPDVGRVFEEGDQALSKRPSSGRNGLSPEDLEHWNDSGFLVLPGFFDAAVIDDLKEHLGRVWRDRRRPANPLMIYTDRAGVHRFKDALDSDRSENYRLLDQYLEDATIRRLCADARLTGILHDLMGHAPIVCNSILFEWGSEQDIHSDMFYMPPISEEQMLATWIALDDVTENNGPLLYVPGSHKLPPYRFSHGEVNAVTSEVPDAVASMQDQIAALGLRTERFFAKRGDVLIWHSQLIHGGDAIHDRNATRTSLVTHYYSTCDLPKGAMLCAETKDGSLLLMKNHLPGWNATAGASSSR